MQDPVSSSKATLIPLLRSVLDEVLADPRFRDRRSASTMELAEHILALAAAGERDIDRLMASAFERLRG